MTTRRQPEPSHAAIIEKIDGLGRLMDARFDGLEGRVKRIEQHLDRQDDAAGAGPWWQQLLRPAALVLLSLFAGGGLTLVALTQLDLLGPILDAARQAHGMGAGQ